MPPILSFFLSLLVFLIVGASPAVANKTKTRHFSHVGDTILRADVAGNVIGRVECSTSGLIVLKEGGMATPFLHNGLPNMRARCCSAYLMRFLTPDPDGFSGDGNWFACTRGNPFSLTDSFGPCVESARDMGGCESGGSRPTGPLSSILPCGCAAHHVDR